MKIKEKYEAISKEALMFREFVQDRWSVGIALVAAFAVKNLVNSLVVNIITPLISYFIGKKSFYDLTFTLSSESVIKYGSFLQELITFMILMFLIYLAAKFLKIKIEKDAKIEYKI